MKENEVLLELMKLRAIYSLKHDSSATEALDYVIFKLNPPKKQTVIIDEADKIRIDMISLVTSMSDYTNTVYSDYLWSEYFDKYSLHTIIHKVCKDPDNFTVYDQGVNILSYDGILCIPKSYEECKPKAQDILQKIINKFNNHEYKDYIEIECDAIDLRIDNLVDICEAIPVDAAEVVTFRPGFRVYDDYCNVLKICNAYLFWKFNNKEVDADERV